MRVALLCVFSIACSSAPSTRRAAPTAPAPAPASASAAAPTPAPAAAPAVAPIDLVLTGGKIFTADPARPWAEALAIRGERIVAVGTTAEIRALPGVGARTRTIELANKVVIPGLNDAHIHAPSVWKPHLIRLASKEPTLDEIAAGVKAAAAAQPPGTWLLVTSGSNAYDHPRATRALFDRIAPKHPVMTYDQGGHAKLLNTAALAQLGIAVTAADPPHGRYGRDPRTKRLNGWLFEYAIYNARATLEDAHDDATIATAAEATERDALAYGITSLQTMGGVAAERLHRVHATRTPLVRWRIVRWPRGTLQTAFDATPASPRSRIAGVKYIVDGTPLERGAFSSRPYADRPKLRGQANFTAAELAQIVDVAATTDEQLLLHAVGDAAIEMILTALEARGDAALWKPRRVRIEHGDQITPAQLARAVALGIVLVQNPVHFLDPAMVKSRWAQCGGTCQPLASLTKAGLAVAIGSDGPLNPFLGIMAATLHPTSPAEALSREQAVIAYTRGAAYAEGQERDKGTLAPGMLADLAVLTADIFTIPPDQLPATKAALTLVGGQIVHELR